QGGVGTDTVPLPIVHRLLLQGPTQRPANARRFVHGVHDVGNRRGRLPRRGTGPRFGTGGTRGGVFDVLAEEFVDLDPRVLRALVGRIALLGRSQKAGV